MIAPIEKLELAVAHHGNGTAAACIRLILLGDTVVNAVRSTGLIGWACPGYKPGSCDRTALLR